MIKSFFRWLIILVLRWEAKLILHRYKPKIVAVTGSVGKTSAKDAIALALQTASTVRASPKSYNSEIGVPLTILGVANAWHHPFGWLKNILHGFCLIIFRTPYPEWLVLEIGADRVGDIQSLGRWLHPDIAVLTSLPLVPAHVEFFPSPEALFAEKGVLLKAVKPKGAIVINADDERVRELVEKLIVGKKLEQRKIIRFGWSDSADIKISDDQLSLKGLTGKVDYAGHTLPLRLTQLYGRQQLYAILAGLAVGVSANYSILPIIQALETYQPPPGRGRLIEGIKNTFILDDSYNASPEAMTAALETLKNFPATGQRIAVLGDMLELGAYTIDAHREIGKIAAKICELIITVGVRAKFIADGATEAGFELSKLLHFDDAREAGQALQPLLLPGDVVLVKGSQAGRLERVVEEIMLHPEDKEKLLARQEPEWQTR
ncbi:MAG: UDP-N-acetylmuramoyl-tripeptide--D-alanyl-D-alanine ligase [Candidatus Vogelbacteria bacterium]